MMLYQLGTKHALIQLFFKITLAGCFLCTRMIGYPQRAPIINATLSGTVMDTSNQKPMKGATVSIEGTTHQAITDKSGRFHFTAGQKFPYRLITCYVGYESKHMAAQESAGIAHPSEKSAIDLHGLNQSQLREAILEEPRLEFRFEGIRWFDLVRTGKLPEVLWAKGVSGVQNYHQLFPLPQTELDVNKLLTQNPGYAN